jgi:hypothetical protein
MAKSNATLAGWLRAAEDCQSAGPKRWLTFRANRSHLAPLCRPRFFGAFGASERNSMPVVVVESPAKAKTINKYLGSNYTVLASYGHVRDLPPKDGSVDPDDNFAMTWEVAADSRKHIKAITDALKTDDELILATDPDREGEAISWHLTEALASVIAKGKKRSAA